MLYAAALNVQWRASVRLLYAARSRDCWTAFTSACLWMLLTAVA